MVERCGPFVDSIYDIHKEVAANTERILEDLFAICGFSKEEVLELAKLGRLETQHHVCEISPNISTYIIILDKQTMFTWTYYIEYDFKANSAKFIYGYEIYKRRKDYE